MRTRPLTLALAVCLVLPAAAAAHPERPAFFPDHRKGSVPEIRNSGPYVVACKPDSRARINRIFAGRGPKNTARRKAQLKLLRRCRFRNIQDAVDAAASNYRVLVLPGVYREEPSARVPYPQQECADRMVEREGPDFLSGANLASGTAGLEKGMAPSYEYGYYCPRSQNLIAVHGDSPDDPDRECDQRCNLQIQGTGKRPTDVLIEGDGHKLNLIKGDRADGLVIYNLSLERSDFNNVYVIETNGFRFSHVVTRYAREYGFLSFASDNGLYEDLDASYAGDSGVYPGSGPEGHCARYGIEIRNVDSHHNNLGYSGTAGNGVWVHDSKFHDNAIGLVTDSFAPGHPGQPQDCAKWESNWIYSNNADLFNDERDAYCKATNDTPWDRDPKKVCPVFQVPVGSGFLIAGGNGNIVRDNWIWDNWRQAGEILYVPATFRGEDDPTKTFDTSNANQITGNHLDRRPDGAVDPNGLGFQWDEEGQGNCWQDNESGLGDRLVNDPARLPACPAGSNFSPGNPLKIAGHASCSTWDPNEMTDPPGCDWFVLPPEPRP